MRTRAVDSSETDARLRKLEPFVKKLIHRYMRKLPVSVDKGDMYTAGMVAAWRTIRAHGHLPESEFMAYLTIRVRGSLVDELRAESHVGRSQAQPRFVDYDQVRLAAPEPERREPDERIPALLAAIEKLPARERAVIKEYVFDGVLLQDIAIRTGVSPPAISQVYTRAKRRLRDALR